jgi:hypothetical protein
MAPPPAYQMQQPPPPTKGKISPLVWILVGIFGLFLLGCIALVGTGLFIARNPGLVIGKLITAGNPDAEVVSTDNGNQTIRVRNRKTGEEVTLSFDDVKNGKFKMSAIGKNGEVANVEIGGGAGKMPSWVPTYPGAKAEGNLSARGDDGSGRGAGGVVSFSSFDAPSKVMEFYTDKINSMGMKVLTSTNTEDGGTIMAQTEDENRTLQVMVGKSGSNTHIALTFGEKN